MPHCSAPCLSWLLSCSVLYQAKGACLQAQKCAQRVPWQQALEGKNYLGFCFAPYTTKQKKGSWRSPPRSSRTHGGRAAGQSRPPAPPPPFSQRCGWRLHGAGQGRAERGGAGRGRRGGAGRAGRGGGAVSRAAPMRGEQSAALWHRAGRLPVATLHLVGTGGEKGGFAGLEAAAIGGRQAGCLASSQALRPSGTAGSPAQPGTKRAKASAQHSAAHHNAAASHSTAAQHTSLPP